MRRFKVLLVLAVALVLTFSGIVYTSRITTNNAVTAQSVEAIAFPTSTLTLPTIEIPTLTNSSVETPTQIPSPTPIPTLNSDQILCNVPLSIMLHWNDEGVLPSILNHIQTNGYMATTYQQWYLYCQQGADTSRMVILSFDDAGPYGIYPGLQRMIAYTDQLGFVGVVGVTRGDLTPGDWDFMRGLTSRGWEIANHSKTHPDMGFPSLSDANLKEDISYVQKRVHDNLGTHPITLILPGGNYDNDTRIDFYAKKYGITFLVGIATALDPWIKGPGPYYVGRAGIDPNNPMGYALQIFNPLQ